MARASKLNHLERNMKSSFFAGLFDYLKHRDQTKRREQRYQSEKAEAVARKDNQLAQIRRYNEQRKNNRPPVL